MTNFKEYPMIKWAKDLFPICRSLTGLGTLKTINYFKKIHPDFNIIKFKTGQKVFDWKIPKEWNILDGYIKHESGKKFASFKKNNLHVVGYSIPININIDKKKLLKNIYTIKEKPNLIPYITSYYEKKWGFCISEKEKKSLPAGKYKAYINSTLKNGEMNIGELVIKGTLKKEIFFSSYICHPSMANNELSGPVVLNAIIKYVKKIKKPKYTYRFVVLPETIGSIAYISKNLKNLKRNVFAGFNLSCVGDDRAYSIVSSRNENTISDYALEAALIGKKNYKKYSYLDRGSDERQYCAPGVDLPLATFCRTKFGEYYEYHTSADNFDVVNSKGLQGSFNVIKNIIDSFEIGLKPKNKIICEPFMQNKKLYPKFSKKEDYKTINSRMNTMNVLFYADGKNTIFDICKIVDRSLESVLNELVVLKDNKLIKLSD